MIKFLIFAFLSVTLVASNTCTGSRGNCACDCSWTGGGKNCGQDDGSCCFGCCCNAIRHCNAGRGSCDCDCSWTDGGKNCGKDDGSCCFGCCCGGSSPTPVPKPVPKPGPKPGPAPTPSHAQYCPSASDLTVAYGSPSITNQGWTVTSGGAVATKAAFNLLGGGVEYDIDFSGTHAGVNANIYTISPTFSGEFKQAAYCDGAKTGSGWCTEVDWIESNGGCGGQTTLHTREGPGGNGCTAWGCANSYQYNGRSSFHMVIKYDTSGHWTTVHDGQYIPTSALAPAPQDLDWNVLREQYSSRGAVIYSSQWVGWVPIPLCGSNGNLEGSKFTVRNLRINGTVVQGPTPRAC